MQAPSIITVACPACSEPIELTLVVEPADPVDGLLASSEVVVVPDIAATAQAHAGVCQALTGGGRDG